MIGLAFIGSLHIDLATTAAAQPIPASLPLGAGPDRFEKGAARVVGSILAYTRWPSPPQTLRLCTIGPVDHAAELGEHSVPSGVPPIYRREVPAGSPAIAEVCDVVYLGRMSLPAMRRVTAAVRGRTVVTIAEADPACLSEAMFCLVFEPTALSFRMNIDAISRSAVRIDPRVLRLSRERVR